MQEVGSLLGRHFPLHRGNRHANLAPPPPTAVLPHRHTRFFGREREMQQLLEWLGGADHPAPDRRLVTLIGPGGVGKTRLALETMRRFTEVQPSPVHFVALADLTNYFCQTTILALTMTIR